MPAISNCSDPTLTGEPLNCDTSEKKSTSRIDLISRAGSRRASCSCASLAPTFRWGSEPRRTMGSVEVDGSRTVSLEPIAGELTGAAAFLSRKRSREVRSSPSGSKSNGSKRRATRGTSTAAATACGFASRTGVSAMVCASRTSGSSGGSVGSSAGVAGGASVAVGSITEGASISVALGCSVARGGAASLTVGSEGQKSTVPTSVAPAARIATVQAIHLEPATAATICESEVIGSSKIGTGGTALAGEPASAGGPSDSPGETTCTMLPHCGQAMI